MGAAERILALALLLLSATFWALAVRRWPIAVGTGIAFLGAIPMLASTLAARFHPGGLLVFLAAALLGFACGMRMRG